MAREWSPLSVNFEQFEMFSFRKELQFLAISLRQLSVMEVWERLR